MHGLQFPPPPPPPPPPRPTKQKSRQEHERPVSSSNSKTREGQGREEEDDAHEWFLEHHADADEPQPSVGGTARPTLSPSPVEVGMSI